MLDEIRGIAGYFTWKYRLIHLAMPFLQSIMRRQLTFQSAYVNNIIEYQSFWNDAVVSMEAGDKEWSRPRLRDAMEFVRFSHGIMQTCTPPSVRLKWSVSESSFRW